MTEKGGWGVEEGGIKAKYKRERDSERKKCMEEGV